MKRSYLLPIRAAPKNRDTLVSYDVDMLTDTRLDKWPMQVWLIPLENKRILREELLHQDNQRDGGWSMLIICNCQSLLSVRNPFGLKLALILGQVCA